jgi:anaerobic selenocysteine-containing dehydrogenase
MRETRPSVCRFCHAGCAILVDVEDGRPVRVIGDKSNPMYRGFTCVKGRQLPQQHAHPERLLHSRKRMPDGSYQPISSQQAFDEIAERVMQIVERHGPRAVATYTGTYSALHAATYPMLGAWMDAIGSPMRFTSNTIDQPGKAVALALHGTWSAPPHAFETADVALLIGVNPLVAMSGGIPNANPAWHLRRALARGLKLLVIDPRRTEVAEFAHIHLQPRPGEDAALLAGLLHVITREGLHDKAFVDENVSGFGALYRALEPFTPEVAARRADVPVQDLIRLARAFASASRGVASTGTGPSMSGRHCTLIEYLALALNSVCGRWMRAGERVPNPGVLLPPIPAKAQANPPWQGYGYGEKMRVRGLSDAACGMPTAALADEILLPGPGQVRALFSVGGNPMAAWPDQKKTHRALQALELCVTLDIKMSATAKLAHYVIAPRLSLEMPGSTLLNESLYYYSIGFGYPKPYAQYTPALVEPPPGSDVIEDWELFWELGRRMGHSFVLRPGVGGVADLSGEGGIRVDMQHKPRSVDLIERLMAGSRVPLDEVRKHPRGGIFEGEPVFVAPRDPGWTGRLEVGNAEMLAELAEAAREARAEPRTPSGEPYDYRLICRRIVAALNSSGRDLPRIAKGRSYNPAFMHPDDLASLGVASGDVVEITSPHGSILGVVEPDAGLRRGLVSMPHSFGDLPGREREVRRIGSNTSQLTSVETDYDRFTGMPRMSDVPVRVTRFAGEVE